MNVAVKSGADKLVSLPGGEKVLVSTAPQPWWTTPYASGFVPLSELAPDPLNPRREMDPVEQKELRDSIRTCGIREALTVTPRSLVPWAKISPEHKRSFFLVVSGHRRREEGLEACLAAAPVRVVIYKSEKDHRLDVSILNKHRSVLSELDQGFEIVRLQKLGCSVEELRRAFGYADDQQVYNRINLTKLAPDLQAHLKKNADRKGKRSLPVTVAGILGGLKAPLAEELADLFEKLKDLVREDEVVVADTELGDLSENDRRFVLHRLLFAAITKRGLNAQRAGEFIREHTLKLKSRVHNGASEKSVNRYQPRKRKETLENFLGGINGSVIVDWSDREFRRIFEYGTFEDVEEFLDKLRQAQGVISNIEDVLKRILATKKPTNPEVARLMAGHTKAR